MNDQIARRNVWVLVFAQTLFGSQLPMLLIFGGLAGAYLAENRGFATLPISMMMLTAMLSAAPLSLFMGRFGRQAGFFIGVSAGAIGGLLGAWALFTQSFMILLIAASFSGVYQAAQAFYRFAAADTASDAFKGKAISWVLAGGLGAALLGPELGSRFHDAFPLVPFAGAYLMIALLNIVCAPLFLLLRIPPPEIIKQPGEGRTPLWAIISQPPILAAIVCAMVSYALMTLVMTATPLAMQACGFSTELAADVVRWHVVAMFAPSFFTGYLIQRFGVQKIIIMGLMLLAVCGVIALVGIELTNFYIALIALGIGWNFGFIGATTLLASSVPVKERARIQGFNDFCVFAFVTVASFASGGLLSLWGWSAVQWAMPPFLLLAVVSLLWLYSRRERPNQVADELH